MLGKYLGHNSQATDTLIDPLAVLIVGDFVLVAFVYHASDRAAGLAP